MRTRSLVGLVVLAVAVVAAYTQLTIFVIQPIGAVPDGRTLVILRLNTMNFVDSADGVCIRRMNGVNLFCRMGVLAAVANNATVLLRLPYSESLYLWSTDGRSFAR